MTDSVMSSDGVMIHYTVQGKGSPEFVFVHGWICNQTYWREQIQAFSVQHRVVAIDLAGHGLSGEDRAEYSISSFGEDVAAVVKKLNLKQAILIGHSMGGPVIAEAAKLLPGRVIGLIGVDTFHNLQKKVTKEEYEDIATALQNDYTGSLRVFIEMAMPAEADSTLREWIIADGARVSPEIAIKVYRCIVDLDIGEMVKEVKLPIFAINSEMWPTDVEGNVKIAPSFEVVLLPGLGHFPMLENPESFNQQLKITAEKIAGIARQVQ